MTVFVLSVLTGREAFAIAPGVAGALSIVPGLGQVANGDVLEGLGWFVASIGLFSTRSVYSSNIGFKIWEYNMYDAYRDAGAESTGKQSVFENYIAVFNPLNLIDPIGLGILGYGTYTAITAKSVAKLGPGNLPGSIIFFSFVGLGEEGLFRGFLFPGFSDIFDSKWIGATLSSVAFSLSHLTNKDHFYHSAEGLSILFAGGMLLCLQTYFNNYDLRHGIFAHSWYDVIVDFGGRRGYGGAPDTFGLKINIPF